MERDDTDAAPTVPPSQTEAEDCFGLLGERLDGKYDIESVVAEGGFGVVYRGTHRGLQKPVAVKVLKIPPELSGATRSEFLAKFALEARTIAALEHPAVVRVMDFGAGPMPKGEAAPWMALEWLTGTTLEADLTDRKGTPRPPAEVLTLMRSVLDAMALAHEEGVVHRDIKPANLMLVSNRRGDVQMKILDFGIAKLMGAEDRSSSGQTATQSTLHAFSLHAAAPEQISGTRTGPWTDVHALGLVISEMLTGCPPYAGSDATEVYSAVLGVQRPTPALHGYDAGVWEGVLAKALSLRPADRYPDARAFSDALQTEVPDACVRRESRVPVPTVRPRSDSDVITTLRPSAKRTDPLAVVPARSIGPIVVACVLTGVLVGVTAWKIGFGTESAHPAHAAPPTVTPPAASSTIAETLPTHSDLHEVHPAGEPQPRSVPPDAGESVPPPLAQVHQSAVRTSIPQRPSRPAAVPGRPVPPQRQPPSLASPHPHEQTPPSEVPVE